MIIIMRITHTIIMITCNSFSAYAARRERDSLCDT